MKKLLTLLFISLFTFSVNAQGYEMVERSWEIFGDNLDSAKILCTKGYYLAKDKGDLKTMGRAMAYRAIYYDIEGQPDSALFLFYKALDIEETVKDTVGLVITYNNLGIFHFSQYQYPMALVYYKKAYNEAMLMNDYSSAAGSLVNMGIIESYEKGGGKALNYYEEASRLYLLTGDTIALQPIYSNTAKIYFDQGDLEKAYAYNLKSIQSPDDNKTQGGWISERILMTNILVAMGKYSDAEKYGLEALKEAEKDGLPERRQYLYEALARLYYNKRDIDKTFYYSNRYRDLRDSLVNEGKAQQIAQMETENKIEKTNSEITKLKLDAERLKNIELQKERYQIRFYSILIVGGIGLIVVVILILLLINNLRLEKANSLLLEDKKNHTQSLLDKEKILMRESHHRIKNNLQFINSILYLQSKNIKDPEVGKALTESRKRIQAISLAHQRLHGHETVEKLDIHLFLIELIDSIKTSSITSNSKIEIVANIDKLTTSTEIAIPVGLIVNELLTNALKYAFTDKAQGIITISLHQKDKSIELMIGDNGQGMPEKKEATGFGQQLVLSMAKQLKADYQITTKAGVNYIFNIPL